MNGIFRQGSKSYKYQLNVICCVFLKKTCFRPAGGEKGEGRKGEREKRRKGDGQNLPPPYRQLRSLVGAPPRCPNSPPGASQRLKPLLEIRPGLTAESASSISQAPIFSRSAASMPEFTARGQPAVETAAGDTSMYGGRICLVHIASSDLQSERRIDA